uniref:NADH-ubiquinone oxidoreductase chain 2 n=1 Tax=Drilaster sp. FM16 TaxID=2596691 RepID=A0A5C0PYR3_9COLE|nr:NADH dehydrogenase subunit 2 [Drilaster sp. FM16]
MIKIYKMMFLSMVFLSTLIAISSYSWLTMWMGLEMNLLAIIPLMQEKGNILSSESAIKYFITQAIASSVIMMTIILMMWKTSLSMTAQSNLSLTMIMNSSLTMKMGMAPFHFWFPEVLEGLNWYNCMLLMTWQKIAPMILFMYNMKFPLMITAIVIASMVVSGIMGLNQISMRKIMAYSSINHMGWMMVTMMLMQTIWMTYFLIYAMMTINISVMMNKNKIFFLNQLYSMLNNSPMMKMFFMLNFLSLSGIPPFIGFMPKWMTIQIMIENNMLVLAFIMIMFTLIMIFIYMRIAISSLLFKINENNWMNLSFKNKNSSTSLLNFFMISSLIIVTMMFNLT